MDHISIWLRFTCNGRLMYTPVLDDMSLENGLGMVKHGFQSMLELFVKRDTYSYEMDSRRSLENVGGTSEEDVMVYGGQAPAEEDKRVERPIVEFIPEEREPNEDANDNSSGEKLWPDPIREEVEEEEEVELPLPTMGVPPLEENDEPYPDPWIGEMDMNVTYRNTMVPGVDDDNVLPPVGVGVRQRFMTKDALQMYLKDYCIRRHVQFKVHKSGPTVYYVCCIGDQCPWHVYASFSMKMNMWKIRRCNDEHTCLNAELRMDNRLCTSKVICNLIMPNVRTSFTLSPHAIIQLVKDKYHIQVSYSRAWRARNKALVAVFGGWEELYNLLPQFFKALHQCRWDSFVRLQYKGCLLIAMSFDGDNRLFPLAFALVEKENIDTWTWFIACLARQVVRGRSPMCIISDHHSGIIRAVADVFPRPHRHRFCIRHIIANLKKRYSVKDLDKMVWRCTSVETVDHYNHAIQNLEEACPGARAELTEGMSPEQWAIAYDGNMSFGKLTTNSSESVNSLLKRARSLPVQALALAIFYRMNAWFVHRREKAAQIITHLCPSVDAHLRTIVDDARHVPANTRLTSCLRSVPVGHSRFIRFRASMPLQCVGAIHYDFHQMTSEYYYVSTNAWVYERAFDVPTRRSTWVQESPVVLPPGEKRTLGRPMSTRIQNEMDWRDDDRGRYLCSICKQPGHNKRACKAPSSGNAESSCAGSRRRTPIGARPSGMGRLVRTLALVITFGYKHTLTNYYSCSGPWMPGMHRAFPDSTHWPMDERMLPYIEVAGFSAPHRVQWLRLDKPLITALVERWRRCPLGITYRRRRCDRVDSGDQLDGVGQSPSGGRASTWKFSGGSTVTIMAQRPIFILVPTTPPKLEILKTLPAFLLHLVGAAIFSDGSARGVHMAYPTAQDFEAAEGTNGQLHASLPLPGTSAACHTRVVGITGCLTLKQERLHIGRTTLLEEPALQGGPLGSRWNVRRTNATNPSGNLVLYKKELDHQRSYQVKWQSYLDFMQCLPAICIEGRRIWLSRIPLICFEIVELHVPDRVMLQFGLDQARGESVVRGSRAHTPRHAPSDYMRWYLGVTRRFISPPPTELAMVYHPRGYTEEALRVNYREALGPSSADSYLMEIGHYCQSVLHSLPLLEGAIVGGDVSHASETSHVVEPARDRAPQRRRARHWPTAETTTRVEDSDEVPAVPEPTVPDLPPEQTPDPEPDQPLEPPQEQPQPSRHPPIRRIYTRRQKKSIGAPKPSSAL
ncbi:hypothetical protein H6P81_020612 [Aristolochia fimbriata]|uniref:Uncharacterized protein n=1 Tax=Aristolochia fimbriata TaxID=158543 RepID=A0AAV7DY52_ARIFI|nr:hypothetical protein H6P81_020612 [Aristolochia fimbriata]